LRPAISSTERALAMSWSVAFGFVTILIFCGSFLRLEL
jgi:hypothetical protein